MAKNIGHIKSIVSGVILGGIIAVGLSFISSNDHSQPTKKYDPIPLKEDVKKKPNVLFIMIDDLRPELNCFGKSNIKSPNIDALANESAVFDKAYCQVPVCGASRASLLTGLRPSNNRFTRFDARADLEAPNAPTLPQWFKEQGYTTISNGKIFHHKQDSPNSWSEPAYHAVKNFKDYQNPENIKIFNETNKKGVSHEIGTCGDYDYADGKVLKKSVEDLKKLSKADKPFFLAVGFVKPHLPFNAPKKYWDLYDSESIQVANNNYAPENAPKMSLHNYGEIRKYVDIPDEGSIPEEQARKLRHGYYACISYVDKLLGELIQSLKDEGVYDNTVIVLCGDHGWTLGEHDLWCKHSLYDLATNTPLMIKSAGENGITPGTRDNIVELLDIYPTLCALTGLQSPEHLMGDNLIKDNSKEVAFSKFHKGESIITKDVTYTEFVNPKNGQILDSMMYNHVADPEENKNIVSDQNYTSKKVEYQDALKALRKSLN